MGFWQRPKLDAHHFVWSLEIQLLAVSSIFLFRDMNQDSR